MSGLYYPTVLGKVECPECEKSNINPISLVNYQDAMHKSALHPTYLNVLFHCPDCGTIFVDYLHLDVEVKRRKLFSLIEELDKEEKLNTGVMG